jgi:predicted dithiol-disulfide oxidoreductase (DUF899 family)
MQPNRIVSRDEWLTARIAFEVDHVEGVLAHLDNHDVSHAVVARAAIVGEIFHTYSVYARGGEEFLGAYRHLDVMPKGRDENGPYHTLADWVRPRNTYGKAGMVGGNGRYHAPGCACAAHR